MATAPEGVNIEGQFYFGDLQQKSDLGGNKHTNAGKSNNTSMLTHLMIRNLAVWMLTVPSVDNQRFLIPSGDYRLLLSPPITLASAACCFCNV